MSVTAELDAPVEQERPRMEAIRAFVWAHPVLSVFLTALGFRLLFVFLFSDSFSGSLVFDDSTYSLMAKQVLSGESKLCDPYTASLYAETRTFVMPLVWVFTIFGPVDAAGQILVALLGAAAAAVTTRVAMEMVRIPLAITAGAIVALLPSQILWSSLTMKDAAVWLLLSVIALLAAWGGRTTGWRLLPIGLATATALYLLGYLRGHSFVVACWAVALAAWVVKTDRIRRGVGALLIGLLIPWLLGYGPLGWTLITNHGDLAQARIENAVGAASAVVDPRKEERDAISNAQIETNERAAEITRVAEKLNERIAALKAETAAAVAESESGGDGTAGDGTAENKTADEIRSVERTLERLQTKVLTLQNSLAEQIAELQALQQDELESLQRGGAEAGTLAPHVRHLPRGTSVVLFEPYPWQSGASPSFNYAKLENFLWYPIFLVAALGAITARKRLRVIAFPLLAGGGILLTYALTEGNVGTAFRHRGELVWIVALLFPLGLLKLQDRRRARRALTADA